MYSSIMVIAAPITIRSILPAALALRSSHPASLLILVAIVLLGVAAAGYFIGREYVNSRVNRRYWK
jgi:membrane protein DedA with SNARE-associated domain